MLARLKKTRTISFLHRTDTTLFLQGARDVMPLNLVVLPWGLLAGSMAVQAGLTTTQAVAMSAVIFAGAAQLLSLNMLQECQHFFAILFSVFILTTQHLLYGLNFRAQVQQFSLIKRVLVGFLLTDELFAVAMQQHKLQFSYLLGAGLCFYLAWCSFSVIGILLAYQLPQLADWHLDFSIAALFILLMIPLIRTRASLLGVVISFGLMFLCCLFGYTQYLILAALIGMLASAYLDQDTGVEQ